jgi:hypothetical protein
MRTSASATRGACGGTRCACSPPRATTGCRAGRFPRACLVVPRQGRDGRLAGGGCGQVRSPRSNRRARGSAFQGGGSVCCDGRDEPIPGRPGRGGSGRLPAAQDPHLRPRARPGHPPAALQPVSGSSQLQEGGVLVVGAANSGAEVALEVSRTHPIWLSGRHPGQVPFRPGGWLGRLLLPVSASWPPTC